MRNAPLRIFPYVAGARSRFSNLLFVDVKLHRRGSNSLVSNTKRVPRVRFHYGYDYAYMDMMTLGVYWSPRNPCPEGEELYKHYVTVKWRPWFRFNWR
jgi:hypothetical protein